MVSAKNSDRGAARTVNRRVSIIIPAYNEESTLPGALSSCRQLKPLEIIVVANGCTDRTAEIAKKWGCQTIARPRPLGNDVGRAIGARQARGDILLFLDADFQLDPVDLRRVVAPLLNDSADVSLNDFTALWKEKKVPHSTTVWRQVFNELLGRKDLGIDSVLSVPHAIKKKVAEAIGFDSLANPILAHMKLVSGGYRIAHQQAVEVLKKNRYRPDEHATSPVALSRSEKRIIADHIEALAHSPLLKTLRGNFTDGGRRRDIVRALRAGKRSLNISPGWKAPSSRLYGGKRLAVIIPAQNEQLTIREAIQNARKIEPQEIIVVVNGSTDRTEAYAKSLGATTIVFKEALGNDVGRAIGAMAANSDILLFIDGDFVLTPDQLFPYARAIARGHHLALNDLNHYLTLKTPLNIITALKYAVNLAADKKQLGVGSLVAVPHAMSRTALHSIHWTSLVSPVLAQMKIMLSGLSIVNERRIDVDRVNRVRPEQHFAKKGYPPAVERIIGDHVEALSYLIQREGNRGVFKEQYRNF